MTRRINVHVVTHTHWDREWYAPFEIFRGRLVELIDGLIKEMDKHPHFKHFMLDGQTVVLEDYLEKRPENKEKLAKLVREEKVNVGPWYILPDEFLVTGESMIRNFLIGQDVLKTLKLPSMKIGYLPDMFGHNAYTPSLLKGLGLETTVIWRGVGDACRDTEFIWESPNGDEILALNLLHGYGNGAHFGRNLQEMKEVFSKEIKFLSEHKTTSSVLMMNGTDHEFPLYELPKEFSKWEKELDVNFIHSTIENYVNSVLNEKPSLKKVHGELKNPKYEPVLKDVTSTRIYLKTLNFNAQQLFTRYVEPLSAYLHMNGENINDEEIIQGWKLILKSQPHDSICGCSVDAVHRDVESRLRNSIELGVSLVAKYMREISSGIKFDSSMGIPILVFNPYEHDRQSIVNINIPSLRGDSYDLVDDKGEKYESFIEDAFEAKEKTESLINEMNEKDHLKSITVFSQFQSMLTPWNLFFSIPKTLTFESKLPPLGFKIFYLRENKEGDQKKQNKEKKESPDFENDFYVFHLNADGSFDLKDKTNNVLYKSVNYFEDVADAGDEYNFSPLEKDEPITTLNHKAKVISVENYGFLKKIKVKMNMEIPKSLDKSRKSRAKEKTVVTFYLSYTLYRDVPRIDVDLTIGNTAMDHKLSFVVKVPEKLEKVENDGYFGMVEHPADIKFYDDIYTEEDISRYAMESFALLKGDKSKLVVTTRGLHEYESHIVEDTTKVNVTLLRSVGWLSRDDLKTRKGHAGPGIPTPEAQCLDEYTYRYAFSLLEKGDEMEAYKASREFLIEPVAIKVSEEQKERKSFNIPKFEFDDGAFLSALKISQDGKNVVMRWVNHSDRKAKVRIESPLAFKIENVNMAEEKIAESKEIKKRFTWELEKNKVNTVNLKVRSNKNEKNTFH